MKVLFLDFDGVLSSSAYFRRVSDSVDGRAVAAFSANQLDPDAIARLNRVVEVTGCRVVVSSSWRLLFKPDRVIGKLSALLRSRGFVGNVLDVTTRCPSEQEQDRAVEIATWLRDARTATVIESFAIVDDTHDAGIGFAPQFVCTSFADGLTDADADRLIAILTRGAEDS